MVGDDGVACLHKTNTNASQQLTCLFHSSSLSILVRD
jgi:hypothetical protein